jgi:hypothetical protein
MKKRYAVVFCQVCNKARIIETDKKTTKCHRCNKRYKTTHLKKYFETDSQEKARIAIGYLHTKHNNKENIFREKIKKT